MDLTELRIGYVPYSNSLDRPGDRRRFCFYAKKRNIKFEIANPSETYDLVIVSNAGDLSVWSSYQKGKAKIVYELINSYLAMPRNNIKSNLRGLAKFVTRQSKYLQLDYTRSIQQMCERSDAVICSTEEQKQQILNYCNNVHIILDIHNNVTQNTKLIYTSGQVFNFVWEGLPYNVIFFNELKDVLKSIAGKKPIALHLITDLEYGQYMGKYRTQQTYKIARKIFDRTYIYEWNEQLCSQIVTACDLALIPIPLNDPFVSGKPENKLLLFWRMGMPTIVSATPAYVQAMERAGLPMACKTQQEWQAVLERYMSDEEARREAGQKGKIFADTYCSEDKIINEWDNLFTSVLNTQ